MSKWYIDDYRRNYGFRSGISPSRKGLFWKSPLALRGDLYKTAHNQTGYPSPYHPHEYTTDGEGVSMSFDLDKEWKWWGGDEVYHAGIGNYPSFISHFGHTHIQSIYIQINSDLASKNHFSEYATKTLNFILNNSIKVFAWFAGLVDKEGNRIPFNPNSKSGMLKGLMSMLIFGEGIDVIDKVQLLDSFRTMAKGHPRESDLMRQVNILQEYYDYVLLNDNVPFLPWAKLMAHHQGMIMERYIAYRDFIHTGVGIEKADAYAFSLYDSGRQMAAFFGTFYSAINFLDTMLDTRVVPEEHRMHRLVYLHDLQYRYWMEHVTFFDDYIKSAVAGDSELMFQVGNYHLESCGHIGTQLGMLFNFFDNLIRNKKIYNIIDSM